MLCFSYVAQYEQRESLLQHVSHIQLTLLFFFLNLNGFSRGRVLARSPAMALGEEVAA